MDVQPLVGICIPTYEHVDLLDRAIKSVIKQTYSNYKIIISDDSKTDIIEKYVRKLKIYSSKVIYVHNKNQLGASANTNKAIGVALKYNVTLIKILYQDDWFTSEDSLKKMVNKLEDNFADVVFTGNLEAYETGITKHICSEKTVMKIENDLTCLFRGNKLGAPSNILYKAVNTSFDETYTWLLDVDFYLRLLPGKKMEYIYEPLMTIGHDGEQLTDYYKRHPKEIIQETFRQYKKYRWIKTGKNRFYMLLHIVVCFAIYLKTVVSSIFIMKKGCR
jgi:glycosyltransferase involved in cell wall biosynthesis